MPRPPRVAVGGVVYHVLNRANGRVRLFQEPGDYEAFERVLAEAHERVPMRLLAYCVMPTHWHLVLWPQADGDLSHFMSWLTLTHTQRWHAAHATTGLGHLYQGRFKSFPVESDGHFLTVCRYVERNPARAGLVRRAAEWPWASLAKRAQPPADGLGRLLALWPVPRPANWVDLVDAPEERGALDAVRRSVVRGAPYGSLDWVGKAAASLGLESTLRSRGRPRRGKGS